MSLLQTQRVRICGFCCVTFTQMQETGQISAYAAVSELGCPERYMLALKWERSCRKFLQFIESLATS